MGITVRFAETAKEIDAVFLARYRVFVESDRYIQPNPDKRILDRFDAFPTTRNVIAECNGRVVGGVRFTDHSEVGTPPEEFFDFRPFLPRPAPPFGAGSMLFLERPFRRSRLVFAMMGMGYGWGLQRDWTHVVGVLNARVVEGFVATGYRVLAEERFEERKRLSFVPVLLDVTDLDRDLLDFASAQTGDPVSIMPDEFRAPLPAFASHTAAVGEDRFHHEEVVIEPSSRPVF
ncbi:MAG TPA: hypothetical protein VH482_25710 [Thermomicrobiales bacterium]|jgi:N-acyl-L-homoserine lactone synthetase